MHQEQKRDYLPLVVNTGFYLNIEDHSVYVKIRYSGVSCTLRPQHRNLSKTVLEIVKTKHWKRDTNALRIPPHFKTGIFINIYDMKG